MRTTFSEQCARATSSEHNFSADCAVLQDALGSFARVAAASVEELLELTPLDRDAALAVYRFFREDGPVDEPAERRPRAARRLVSEPDVGALTEHRAAARRRLLTQEIDTEATQSGLKSNTVRRFLMESEAGVVAKGDGEATEGGSFPMRPSYDDADRVLQSSHVVRRRRVQQPDAVVDEACDVMRRFDETPDFSEVGDVDGVTPEAYVEKPDPYVDAVALLEEGEQGSRGHRSVASAADTMSDTGSNAVRRFCQGPDAEVRALTEGNSYAKHDFYPYGDAWNDVNTPTSNVRRRSFEDDVTTFGRRRSFDDDVNTPMSFARRRSFEDDVGTPSQRYRSFDDVSPPTQRALVGRWRSVDDDVSTPTHRSLARHRSCGDIDAGSYREHHWFRRPDDASRDDATPLEREPHAEFALFEDAYASSEGGSWASLRRNCDAPSNGGSDASLWDGGSIARRGSFQDADALSEGALSAQSEGSLEGCRFDQGSYGPRSETLIPPRDAGSMGRPFAERLAHHHGDAYADARGAAQHAGRRYHEGSHVDTNMLWDADSQAPSVPVGSDISHYF